MKILVVYYSFEGNTEFAAKLIAEKTGADLIRLKPEYEPPRNALKFLLGGKAVIRNEKAEIYDVHCDPTEYDLIFVGSPVWAGRVTPAIREFLISFPFEHKKAVVFASSAGGNADGLFKSIRSLLAGNEIVSQLSLKNPLKYRNRAEKQIDDLLKELGMEKPRSN